jgi:iron complex transport system ATP-binding protein
MVLDEPTASLDFGNQARVLERVLGLASRGMGILLSTHNPDHALLCANRVLLLHAGRVIADGRPGEVITPENLRKIYGVDVELTDAGSGASRRTLCIPLVARSRVVPHRRT